MNEKFLSFRDLFICYWAHALVFLGVASTLLVRGGYTYWALSLSLISIFSLRLPQLQSDYWARDSQVFLSRKWLWGAFIVYVVSSLFLNFYHQSDLGHYQNVLPFLIYPIYATTIVNKRVNPLCLFFGAAFGAIGAGGFAIWQFLSDPTMVRAHGHINPITFGDTSVVLGAASLIGLINIDFSRFTQKNWARSLLALGTLFGALASLLSGSKGGWLSLVTIFGFGLISLWKRSQRLARFTLIPAVLLASSLITLALPQETFSNRIVNGWNGLKTYLATQEVTEMSVSIRLELWRVGLKIFSENPIVGVGDTIAEQRRAELSASGTYSPLIAEIHTFDSEYINTLASGGLIGFMAHLTIFILPILAFARFRTDKNPTVRALSLLGVMLPIIYMEFGLSVSIFGTNAFRQVYASWLVLILALIAGEINADRVNRQ